MQFKMKAMETEQDDLQFLGTCGIFKESIKIILTWPKIFIQITLAFILPNYCLSLAMNWISMLLISKNFNNNSILLATKQVDFSAYHDHISNSPSSELPTYMLMMLASFIVSIISLLSSSTVAYAVASIYACNEITFRKVITVIPKAWNRLVITYICESCIIFALFFIPIFIFVSSMLFLEDGLGLAMSVLIVLIMGVSSMVGFYYVSMIWQLANVVSVLEKYCGVKALKKSKDLIKGKMTTAFAIVLVMNLFAMPLTLLSLKLADFGIVGRLCFGILSLVSCTLFSLFSLVVKTIFYLVCKSHHHESVDESCLADHLGFYGGEYAPLKTSEVMQQEYIQVV